MKTLVLCTLDESNSYARKAIDKLDGKKKIYYTEKMNIHSCIGCTNCWLKTPGVCCIKDDYEIILKEMLTSDKVVYVGESKLGFVSYKVKNLIDRVLPLAEPFIIIKDGQARHVARYEHKFDTELLYTGDGDEEFLNRWMGRVMKNLHLNSLGAKRIDLEE